MIFSVLYEEAIGSSVAIPPAGSNPKITIDLLRRAFPNKYIPVRPYRRKEKSELSFKSDVIKKVKTKNSFGLKG